MAYYQSAFSIFFHLSHFSHDQRNHLDASREILESPRPRTILVSRPESKYSSFLSEREVKKAPMCFQTHSLGQSLNII